MSLNKISKQFYLTRVSESVSESEVQKIGLSESVSESMSEVMSETVSELMSGSVSELLSASESIYDLNGSFFIRN